MLSSRSINILYFYSTVPQGYFLLLWFGNVLLSCALMLVWKFDALDAASSPSLHRGNTSFSPLHSHLIWHPSCFSAPSSTSHLLLPFFLFPLLFYPFSHLVECAKTACCHFFRLEQTLLFLKYSPLVDLIGAVPRRSAWNMVCGAFKELPGESCT